MRRTGWGVVCCALSLASPFGFSDATAQTQSSRIRLQTAQDEIQPDGSDILTQHVEMLILNKVAASTLGQFPITYSEGSTDLSITEAYTLKPDGQKIPLDPATIITQQPPGNNPLMALFTDTKQKILIFPNVQVGDTIVFTEKRHNKQLYFPGQFLRQGDFLPNVPVDDSSITLQRPCPSLPKLTTLNFRKVRRAIIPSIRCTTRTPILNLSKPRLSRTWIVCRDIPFQVSRVMTSLHGHMLV